MQTQTAKKLEFYSHPISYLFYAFVPLYVALIVLLYFALGLFMLHVFGPGFGETIWHEVKTDNGVKEVAMIWTFLPQRISWFVAAALLLIAGLASFRTALDALKHGAVSASLFNLVLSVVVTAALVLNFSELRSAVENFAEFSMAMFGKHVPKV